MQHSQDFGQTSSELKDSDAALVGRLLLSAQKMAAELVADAQRQATLVSGSLVSGSVVPGLAETSAPDPLFAARVADIERQARQAIGELDRAEAGTKESFDDLHGALERQRQLLRAQAGDGGLTPGSRRGSAPGAVPPDSGPGSGSVGGHPGVSLSVNEALAALGVSGLARGRDPAPARPSAPTPVLSESSNAVDVIPVAAKAADTPISAPRHLAKGRARTGLKQRLWTGGAGLAVFAGAIEIVRHF